MLGAGVEGRWVEWSHVTKWPHSVASSQTNPDSLTLLLHPGKWD